MESDVNLPSGGHVRANGIRQHYLHFPGQGKTVVIVPGIVSAAALWAHVGQWLSDVNDCYVLDVRGRGLSEAGAHLDYGVDACAVDVAAFVETMGLGAVTLVGHSMGARISMRVASLRPEATRAVVLVDPPTSGPGRRMYPVPKARTLALLRAAHQGHAEAALASSSTNAWPPELQRVRIEWLSTCDERAVHAAYDDFHDQDLFADLARITIPLALVCAGEGGVVSDADVQEMQALRPDLFSRRLEGAGHQLQAEDFEGFKSLLGEALSMVDR
jgi:N-formylmaleamate deformylase